MTIERERLAWQSIVHESRRRRQRRREGSAIVLAILLAVAGTGAARILGDGRSATRVAAGPTGPGPSVADVSSADPRALAGGPVPSLGRLFALPACSGGADDLTGWMVDVLAPYISVNPAGAGTEPVAGAADVAPVPAGPVPAGACATAVRAGDAHAWQLRATDGTVLARGAGTPLTSRTVPARLTNQRTLYHQESVASGQPFSGVVDGSRVEGFTSSGVVVVDAPAVATTVTDLHAAGMQVLAGLSFASVAPLGLDGGFKLPTVAPPGFTRCTGDVGYLLQTGGTLVDYCDAAGRTITAGWGEQTAGVAGGRAVDIRGFPGSVSTSPAKRVTVSVDVVRAGAPDVHARIEGPDEVGPDVLTSMLRSVPALDPRVLTPRAGHGDLRSLVDDGDRLRALLGSAGATAITVPAPRSCIPDIGPAGPVPTTISLPCPLPAPVTLTVPAGSTAMLYILVAHNPDQTFAGLLPQATDVETVAGIDVLERRTGGTAPERNGGEQALFVCGGVQFNFLGNDVIAFTKALVPRLDC
jgi:hypothetical protein